MVTKILTPAPPVLEYQQWTGDNLTELQQFVEIQNVNLDVDGAGGLLLYAGTSGQTPLPAGAWLARQADPAMPVWFPDEQASRYREVPAAESYSYDITTA